MNNDSDNRHFGAVDCSCKTDQVDEMISKISQKKKTILMKK